MFLLAIDSSRKRSECDLQLLDCVRHQARGNQVLICLQRGHIERRHVLCARETLATNYMKCDLPAPGELTSRNSTAALAMDHLRIF